MLWRFVFISTAGFLISFANSTLADWRSDYAGEIDRRIRTLIQENATSSLKRSVLETGFESLQGVEIPNAYAGVRNGRPVIGINPGLISLASYVSEINTLLVLEGPQWLRCQAEYSAYLRDAFLQMGKATVSGRDVTPLTPPESFQQSCSGIESRFPFSGRAKHIRDQMLQNALTFIYFHEIGHILLGHLNSRNEMMPDGDYADPVTFFKATCQQRHHEAEADKFATRTLINIGAAPVAFDITIWNVMLATGTLDPSFEVISTHPSPSVRFANALSEAEAYFVAGGGTVSQELSDLIKEAITLQSKIERTLPAIEYPDAKGYQCEN